MAREDLTLKQKAFADYYIECGNATEAAIKAGYSKKTAYAIGTENLKKPLISAYIAERLKPIEGKRIATADEVMVFLTKMMYGEIKDAFGMDASNTDRLAAAREILKRHNAAIDNNKDALEKLDDILDSLGGVI